MDGQWVLALLEGMVSGSVLALTALGLSLVFGVMRVVNVAHGEFFMLGAVAAWYVSTLTGSFVAAIVIGPVARRRRSRSRPIGSCCGRFGTRPRPRSWPRSGCCTSSNKRSLLWYGPAARAVPAPVSFHRRAALVRILRLQARRRRARRCACSAQRGRSSPERGSDSTCARRSRMPEIAKAFGVPVERVYSWTFAVGARSRRPPAS